MRNTSRKNGTSAAHAVIHQHRGGGGFTVHQHVAPRHLADGAGAGLESWIYTGHQQHLPEGSVKRGNVWVFYGSDDPRVRRRVDDLRRRIAKCGCQRGQACTPGGCSGQRPDLLLLQLVGQLWSALKGPMQFAFLRGRCVSCGEVDSVAIYNGHLEVLAGQELLGVRDAAKLSVNPGDATRLAWARIVRGFDGPVLVQWDKVLLSARCWSCGQRDEGETTEATMRCPRCGPGQRVVVERDQRLNRSARCSACESKIPFRNTWERDALWRTGEASPGFWGLYRKAHDSVRGRASRLRALVPLIVECCPSVKRGNKLRLLRVLEKRNRSGAGPAHVGAKTLAVALAVAVLHEHLPRRAGGGPKEHDVKVLRRKFHFHDDGSVSLAGEATPGIPRR